jgi:hypothetical protein
MPAGAVQNPANLTVVSVESSAATIHTTVQTWLRANMAVNDSLYNLSFIPNKFNDKVTCIILFEDQ